MALVAARRGGADRAILFIDLTFLSANLLKVYEGGGGYRWRSAAS